VRERAVFPDGLSDVVIIKELYDASQAGVPIDLFVRGACRLRPGLPGLSDNIRVFSWVGPVLQHRRIYYYYANGEEKYHIGSADWRTRNLNERTEVVIPVYNDRIKRRLSKILASMNDHQHLWQLQSDGRYYKGLTSESLSIVVSPAVVTDRETSKSELAGFQIANGDADLAKALEPSPVLGSGASVSSLAGLPRDSTASFGKGALVSAGTMPSLECADDSGRGSKHRTRYTVNIKGTEMLVEKIAAGAVPVRYTDPTDITTLQVLIVRRSANDDPWSVPKGGMVEGETPPEAAERITREKAGVYSSEHVGTLGWILRKKRHKTIAITTYILRVLELGQFSSALHERTRKWVPFPEAIDLAISSKNCFTIDALQRAYQLCQVKFAEALQAVDDEEKQGASSGGGERTTDEALPTSGTVLYAADGPGVQENGMRVDEADDEDREFDPSAANGPVATDGAPDMYARSGPVRDEFGDEENEGAAPPSHLDLPSEGESGLSEALENMSRVESDEKDDALNEDGGSDCAFVALSQSA
jgi:ADP-ribose pyrophosphatase YjhB (NUDIX family)